jgi:Glycosyltransferase Family 4/Glycosyl transferases group 1
MTRFLFVAYHFPPIGGAGVQRAVQLCRHLPAHDYEPVVLTGPGEPEYRWTPRDLALAAGAEPATDVHRVSGPEPERDGAWRGRAERWLRVTMRWQRWWAENALDLARRAGRDCDLVYASLAPYQTAETATAIAKELRRPLVVDLEDPWALDEMMVFPTDLHRWRERARMRRVLQAADVIIMNTEEAARVARETFPELADRVVAIPNRYEADDFRGPAGARRDDRFRIVHTGSMHTDLGWAQRRSSGRRRLLGGAEPGVDFLTRSHVFLLEALDRLADERPDIASTVELHLAGVLTEEDMRVAAASRFAHVQGFLSHRETIALVQSADLLFLPMHNVSAGARARIVPQKTYEYVASGRPILAAVPDGDARRLLAEAGTARLCRPADIAGMAAIVTDEVQRWRSGEAEPAPNPEVLARFDSRRLAGDVAAIFDRVTGKGQAGADTLEQSAETARRRSRRSRRTSP